MSERKLLRLNGKGKIHFSHSDSFYHGSHHVGQACKTGNTPVDSFEEIQMSVEEFRQAISENKICKTCLNELLRWKGGRMGRIENMIEIMN
tara:strand:+ start:3379 stop:3651 length:273 start_codon:yes stop_codon:yes gene_type:complete